jgi:lipoyl(octanoyl) transferase
MQTHLQTRFLSTVDYATSFAAMQTFTAQRTSATADELWLCEHAPVFTQGLAGKPEHLLGTPAISTVQTDRGGQVTYHGPGQVVAYPLLDLHRLGIFVKEYVYRLEDAAIVTLAHYGITGHRVAGAPGIYVRLNEPFSHAILPKGDAKNPQFTGLGKIAALGVKISRGHSYHGLSLNVAMDLEPFTYINPCGYAGLTTVDMAGLGVNVAPNEVAGLLADKIAARFTVSALDVESAASLRPVVTQG